MKKRILEQLNPDGSITNLIELTNEDGSFAVYPEDLYNEMVASQEKQSGTL